MVFLQSATQQSNSQNANKAVPKLLQISGLSMQKVQNTYNSYFQMSFISSKNVRKYILSRKIVQMGRWIWLVNWI